METSTTSPFLILTISNQSHFWLFPIFAPSDIFNTSNFWHFPFWTVYDTFQFWHFPIWALSDTFQFWNFPIPTISDTFQSKQVLTLSKLNSFWHFPTLTLSYFDTFWFWQFPILTISNFGKKRKIGFWQIPQQAKIIHRVGNFKEYKGGLTANWQKMLLRFRLFNELPWASPLSKLNSCWHFPIILTLSNSDTFQFWYLPIILTLSNSDTFQFWYFFRLFWHFSILTLSNSDTFSNSNTFQFWHFPISHFQRLRIITERSPNLWRREE